MHRLNGRLTVVVAILTELIFGASCSSSTPMASPTATRLIAGTYHYQIKSAACPGMDQGQITDLGPVDLSQDGTTVTIDSHQDAVIRTAALHLSGTMSGATLAFQLSADGSTHAPGFNCVYAEGTGTAIINGQSISGVFSGTTTNDSTCGLFASTRHTCTSENHSLLLTRVS